MLGRDETPPPYKTLRQPSNAHKTSGSGPRSSKLTRLTVINTAKPEGTYLEVGASMDKPFEEINERMKD
jgi:hypothetical protein